MTSSSIGVAICIPEVPNLRASDVGSIVVLVLFGDKSSSSSIKEVVAIITLRHS